MSKKEKNRRTTVSRVMKVAHVIHNQSLITLSEALKLSWKLNRSESKFISSTAKGVSFFNDDGVSRQAILHALTKYPKDQILLRLEREPKNQWDSNAVKVMVMVRNKGIAQVGYLSKEIAAEVSTTLDQGNEVIAIFETITGGDRYLCGLNFSYATV